MHWILDEHSVAHLIIPHTIVAMVIDAISTDGNIQFLEVVYLVVVMLPTFCPLMKATKTTIHKELDIKLRIVSNLTPPVPVRYKVLHADHVA